MRRASTADAEAIALAHVDSIRSIGPHFYSSDVVEAWGAGLLPDVYVRAMEGGEAFFIAIGDLDGQRVVLGFSTHRVDDDRAGVEFYRANGFKELGRGEARLMSERTMPCVFMRKTLAEAR